MKVELNPCQACLNKVTKDRWNVNIVNQCCYETLAAFRGSSSVNAIRNSSEAQNCARCVKDSILKSGKNLCDLRVSPPPIWSQTPHYFPGMLQELKDVNRAKESCYKKCETTPYPNQCKINCRTDAAAVVSINNEGPKEFAAAVSSTQKEINDYGITVGLLAVLGIIVTVILFGIIKST